MRIWIDTSNAEFDDDPRGAVVKTLHQLADRIRLQGLPRFGEPQTIKDVNGNSIGGYCDSRDHVTEEQWQA